MIYVHLPDMPSRPDVHIAASPAQLAASMIAAAIERSVRAHGRCRMVVGAGAAVGPVLDGLRELLDPQAYPRLFVTAAAEPAHRFAPPDPQAWQALPADSTLRLIMERWLAHVPMRPQQILPMTLGGEAEHECVRYGRELKQVFAGGVDVAVIGVAADGTIAGLPPAHPALDVDDVCMVVHADVPVLTVGLPVLQRARHRFVLAATDAGPSLLQAWQGRTEQPLSRLQDDGTTYWVVDPDLGQQLLAHVHGENT